VSDGADEVVLPYCDECNGPLVLIKTEADIRFAPPEIWWCPRCDVPYDA